MFISLVAMLLSSLSSGKKDNVVGSGVSVLICGLGSFSAGCPDDSSWWSSSFTCGRKSASVSHTPGCPKSVRVNHTCSVLEYLVNLP